MDISFGTLLDNNQPRRRREIFKGLKISGSYVENYMPPVCFFYVWLLHKLNISNGAQLISVFEINFNGDKNVHFAKT